MIQPIRIDQSIHTGRECPVCPWCAWEHGDCSEAFVPSITGEAKCNGCGVVFIWIRGAEVRQGRLTWTTYKKQA